MTRMTLSRRVPALAAGLMALTTAAGILTPSGAHASAVTAPVPPGTLVDGSFDPSAPAVVVGDDGPTTKGACSQYNFTAVLKWSNSVNGCNVIGTANSTKVGYQWETTSPGYATINAKGFNANRQMTWYSAGSGTGRTININWGNVAASKMIQGVTNTIIGVQIRFS